MRKNVVCRTALFVCVLLFAVQAAFAVPIEAVGAYLYPGMTVQYNDHAIAFTENGEQLAPIVYQGVTYVPAIQFAEEFGLDSQWDQQTLTLSFGEAKDGIDFIDNFIPYSAGSSFEIIPSTLYALNMIGGNMYTHWIKVETLGSGAYYNLEGKYSSITFKAYTDSAATGRILFIGDNNRQLAKCDVVGKALAQTYTVDVTGVVQLQIVGHFPEVGWLDIYLMDMTIR